MSWFEFITKEAEHYPISSLCEAVGVTTGAYYTILNRGLSDRSKEDEIYKSKILEIHQHSRYRYGHRPMYQHLQDEGIRCGRDRTRRLMKELSIQPRKRQTFKPQTTDSDHDYGYSPNLIKTIDKTSLEVDEIWVADTTYISIGFGWVYLAVIMDRSSRRIIGWSTSLNNDTALVVQALKNAVLTRGKLPLGTIHHSDRGSTYASHKYQDLLKAYGMKSSMSAKGNCYDNAAMESFFGRYKTCNIQNFEFTNSKEVRKHIFDYIEVFYNRYRKHSSIGNISPMVFEEKVSP